MKRRRHASLILAISLIAGEASAQGVPVLSDLVGSIRSNSLPSRAYDVSINQTIDGIPGSSMRTSIDAGTMTKQNSFTAEYTPARGIVVQAPRVASSNTRTSLAKTESGDMKMTVNLNTVYDSAEEWQNVKIVSEVFKGRDHHVVSGTYKVVDFTLWIDAERFTTSRMTMKLKGELFSDADFQYERVGDEYWLPSVIVVRHAHDGSIVTQRLGNYLLR